MEVFHTAMDNYNWRTDEVYMKWQKENLYDRFFSFDEVVEFVGVDKWPWLEGNRWKDDFAKAEWARLVNRWNQHNKITRTKDSEPKTKGFAAITLLYVALPYNLLNKSIDVISDFQAKMIVRCVFYESNMCYILDCFETDEDLTGGPVFPPAYEQWINQLYNEASWWLSFFIYDKLFRSDKPQIKPQIIPFHPAKWKKE